MRAHVSQGAIQRGDSVSLDLQVLHGGSLVFALVTPCQCIAVFDNSIGVWRFETDTRRGLAIVLDIWRCMHMMRKRGCQAWIVGMRLRIVPADFLIPLKDSVAVVSYAFGFEIQYLDDLDD